MEYKIKFHEMVIKEQEVEEFIKTPDAVYEAIKDEFELNESIILVGMNIKNKVVFKKTLVIGGYNAIMCTPADIFTPLLLANCRNFVLAHNHPSEDCSPSKEDTIFTKKIEKASAMMGLNFLDHLIVAQDDYYSFKKNGVL